MGKYKVRDFNLKEDYADVCGWWEKAKWPHVPTDHLPPTGLICETKEIKLCALWVYLTQSKFAIMEWFVVNPEAPMKLRVAALSDTIDVAKYLAKQAGSETIFSSVSKHGLITLLEKKGFNKADIGMTNMTFRSL